MMRVLQCGIVGMALSAVLCGPRDSAHAGTIVNLRVDPAGIGIQFDGATLSTVGPQNTPAEFTGFLDWYPDITTSTASLIFGGVMRTGSTIVNGTSILQQFVGGTLSLYDASQTLLLSGNLSNSALSGASGRADGGLFTTSFSTVTGGLFAAYVDRPSLVFQMHISNINGGAGLSTSPPSGGVLQSFTANVNANMGGIQIPEPATYALLAILTALTLASTLSRRPRKNSLHRR